MRKINTFLIGAALIALSFNGVAQTTINTFPWTEDFENDGSIPGGWVNETTDQANFEFVTSYVNKFNSKTKIDSDHSSGAGYFALFRCDDFNKNDSVVMTSPVLNLTTLTKPELSFFRMRPFSSGSKFTINVFANGQWNYNIKSGLDALTPSGWAESLVDLSSYKAADVKIQFVVVNGFSPVGLDDVSIKEAPTCSKIMEINATSYSADNANVSWVNNSGATSWQIEYMPKGTAIGAGKRVVLNAVNYTLTDLLAGTQYDFYVRAICGDGDTSVWSDVVSFKTNCKIVTYPYVQNFDGQESCWITTEVGDQGWSKFSSDQIIEAHSGESYMDGAGTDNGFLITPLLYMDANSKMKWFEIRAVNGDEYAKASYEVLLSTTDTRTTSFRVKLGTFDKISDTILSWVEKSVDLSAYAGQQVYIAFHVLSGDFVRWGIDDVTITGFYNSIEDKKQAESLVNVYPNPNNGVFSVDVDDATSIELVNIQGKVVFAKELNGSNHIENIDVRNLAKGMYFLKVNNNKNTSVTKVMID